jgi:methylated-DNA-[protein]-cysteine S-methyltransferase
MTETALTETPFGPIALSWSGDRLTRVDLNPAAMPSHCASPAPGWLRDELGAYLRDPAHRPRVPVRLGGTAFQRRVWGLLARIPAGETRTYGALAADLGSSARAVGNACRANPCPLVIPCHRVVAVHGLGGFAGDRDGRLLAIKRWLLVHEGVEPRWA